VPDMLGDIYVGFW